MIILHSDQFRFYGFNKKYERQGIYNLEEILPRIGPSGHVHFLLVPGYGKIALSAHRYQLFQREQHNLSCVSCGFSGLYFALERHIRSVPLNQKRGERVRRHRIEHIKGSSWHFNLYGLNEAGEERMLTKDHIMPKSKGGANAMWNYQLMCDVCNVKKGCVIPLPAGIPEVMTISVGSTV